MFKSILFAVGMLSVIHSSAQNYSIHGVVQDSKRNQGLPGATIEVAGSRNFAITDQLGRFQLDQLSQGPIELIIRYVGFQQKKETVNVPVDNLVILLDESATITEEVIVYATRANGDTPATFSTVTKQSIDKQNFGQDLPYLLNWSPSLVTNSDAGTGFGYTGVRIRGSDATSINVTINGIPYNDSESLGTFWVDIPDIASSAQNIQIQRGVGTSTNGAGAFGATINLQTNSRNDVPYATFTNSVGFLEKNRNISYNSRKHTIAFGTGLINNHWIVDGRFSKIQSEGFIDRATADLGSHYFSAAYYSAKTIVKAITFGGKERTYQAWYGVPQSRLNNDEEAMLVTAGNEGWNEEQTQNLLNSDSRTFNPYTYKNQVDDYKQDHYQLHLSHTMNEKFTGNLSLHYTPGKGYYEEYKYKDEFSDYGLAPVVIGDSTIAEADLVRRRWLDNDFYGFTTALNYQSGNTTITLSAGGNRYRGGHFGEIIWSEVAVVPTEYKYYNNHSDKKDFNIFLKANFPITEKLNAYIDVQERAIRYEAQGLDNGNNLLSIDQRYYFFNPKAGLIMDLTGTQQLYSSVSVAHREPVRSDFVNAPQGKTPSEERLTNVEAGYRLQNKNVMLNANYYLMLYKDQLIHTGMVNDVGSPIRTNVDKSYRSGIELEALVSLTKKWSVNGNVTFSENKINNFSEVLYDYGADWDQYNEVVRSYKNTDIAFSPSTIAGLGLTFRPVSGLDLTLLSKYVGRQFMDNTSNKSRSLDPYFVNDIRATYSLKPRFVKEVTFSLLVNNLFNEQFESNGYTWGYLGGGEEYRENYFYPQAGRNFMIMMAIHF